MNNYDPYKILHVNYTDDLTIIRNAFKKQALIHHPDRGGNKHIFDLCTRAYRDIYKFKQHKQKQLSKENRSIGEMKQARSESYSNVNLDKRQQKDLERNFNRIFDNVRVETPNDIGYGHTMAESKGLSRSENPELDGKEGSYASRQLVVFEEPQPLSTLKDNYELLGEEKVKDFSKSHSGGSTQYTDYMVAHSEQDSINTMKNVRDTSYKTIEELKHARGNIRFEMSPQAQQKYNMKMQREKEIEEKRQMLFYKHKEDVSKKFNSIHNYLTH